MTRRRIVLASIGSAGMFALAGCSGDESSDAAQAVSALDGLRWEMPCQSEEPADICEAQNDTTSETAEIGGSDGTRYEVTLQFRGVVEQMSYEGGTADDFWYTGGSPAGNSYNIYRLDASAPDQHFFVNAGESGTERCFQIDYTQTIEVDSGATVTLTADAQDGRLISNVDGDGEPIVVPDVSPAPDPYNGQFVEITVDSATTV